MSTRPLFLLGGLLTLGIPTRADVLPPPSAVSCPPGSAPRTVHAGTLCELVECARTPQCPGGECLTHDVCVAEVPSGGLGGATVRVHRGRCSPGAFCPGGETCQTVGVCVRADFQGCTCMSAGTGRGSVGFGWLLVLGVVMFARRGRPSG